MNTLLLIGVGFLLLVLVLWGLLQWARYNSAHFAEHQAAKREREHILVSQLIAKNQATYDQSVREWQSALNNDPNSEEAYLHLASHYGYSGNDRQKSIEYYSKAIELNPRRSDAYYGRAVVYWKESNYDKAMIDLDQAINIGTNNYDAYMLRGHLHSDRGDWESAVGDFQKAQELAEENMRKYGGGAAMNPAYDDSVEARQQVEVHKVAIELRHKGLEVLLENCKYDKWAEEIRILVEDANGQQREIDWQHK